MTPSEEITQKAHEIGELSIKYKIPMLLVVNYQEEVECFHSGLDTDRVYMLTIAASSIKSSIKKEPTSCNHHNN